MRGEGTIFYVMRRGYLTPHAPMVPFLRVPAFA